MDEAAASTWRPDDLQTWAGETIAELDGRRGGVGDGRRRRGNDARSGGVHRADGASRPWTRLPDTDGMPAEIIVQRGHRNAYDRAFRTAGARIVEVGYPWIEGVGLTYEWQLEAAFSERTVAVGQLALADADGVPLRRVCELAGGARRARDRRCGGRAAARRRTSAGSSTRAPRSSSSAAARRSAARRDRASSPVGAS